MITVCLIILGELVFLFTCVLGDQAAFNSAVSSVKRLDRPLDNSKWTAFLQSDSLPKESSFFKSFTSVSSSASSSHSSISSPKSYRPDRLLRRIKRENQLLINNELASGLGSHDSNTFQPNGESSRPFLFRSFEGHFCPGIMAWKLESQQEMATVACLEHRAFQ